MTQHTIHGVVFPETTDPTNSNLRHITGPNGVDIAIAGPMMFVRRFCAGCGKLWYSGRHIGRGECTACARAWPAFVTAQQCHDHNVQTAPSANGPIPNPFNDPTAPPPPTPATESRTYAPGTLLADRAEDIALRAKALGLKL